MTKYLSPAEVALALGISRTTAYRLVSSLPHTHVGRLVRVSERDLNSYLAKNTERGWLESTNDEKAAPTTPTTPRSADDASSEASAPATGRSRRHEPELPSWAQKPLRVAKHRRSPRQSTG